MYVPNYNVVRTKKKRVVSKKKLSEFETFKKDAPELPDFTCPHIDNVNDWLHKANEEMELLREMNSKLRDNAEYWKESCEEMQNKLNEIRDWQKNLLEIASQDI
tara:strand:+ start:886 stop:1197 length:312 start_codon:yes stop_codon:yes gene_type:complete